MKKNKLIALSLAGALAFVGFSSAKDIAEASIDERQAERNYEYEDDFGHMGFGRHHHDEDSSQRYGLGRRNHRRSDSHRFYGPCCHDYDESDYWD